MSSPWVLQANRRGRVSYRSGTGRPGCAPVCGVQLRDPGDPATQATQATQATPATRAIQARSGVDGRCLGAASCTRRSRCQIHDAREYSIRPSTSPARCHQALWAMVMASGLASEPRREARIGAWDATVARSGGSLGCSSRWRGPRPRGTRFTFRLTSHVGAGTRRTDAHLRCLVPGGSRSARWRVAASTSGSIRCARRTAARTGCRGRRPG